MVTEYSFDRINYQGSPSDLVTQICDDFKIGQLQFYLVPPMGYEDLNVALRTSEGEFFAKIFASSRDEADVRRYITTMEKVLNARITHPALYLAPDGTYLHEIPINNSPLRMVLMQFIDGGTILEGGRILTNQERQQLIQQTALINSLGYKPKPVYDSWAIVNFLAEFERKRHTLAPGEENVIGRVADQFNQVCLTDLPQAFVHGDIRSSNAMRNTQGELYVIDFAVANWQPRIVELAVLLSELFFNPDHPQKTFDWVTSEYQKYAQLMPEEIALLPLFIQVGHAMNLLGASFEKAAGNTSKENNTWLQFGRNGLGLL